MKATWIAAIATGMLAAACEPDAADDGRAGDAGDAADGNDGAGTDGYDSDYVPVETDADPEECRDVDILFVIDNSSSMGDNQDSLIASFPGFVSTMREQLAYATSFHVGVVTSDAYSFNEPGCRQIGDLVTVTGGFESSRSTCTPFSTGGRYMDATEPDLSTKFSCAAKVGSGGNDDERVARAFLDAVDPARNAPGACNAGFIRSDSLLVIVIITDEDDVPDVCEDPENPTPWTCQTYGSGGTPDDWVAELASHRGGHRENIVVLSLLGMRGDNPCGAMVASKLMGFAHRFGDNGFVGDVCASSYDAFFADALPVIDRACENFVIW